jgi:4-amino-4-deoxy-L-arabinose transferase-like glycosyltransferase
MTAIRLVIISTIGLSDTEAYYLTWSRFPDWSYYDHPPLIAWIMSATTVGSTSPFFVRLGSVVCSGLFGFLVNRLATRLFASPRAGFLALLVVSILPAFFFTGFLANPEAPLAPLWVLYLILLEDLRHHDEAWRPLLVGAVIGVGFLAKYTALLAVPITVLFVVVSPGARRWLRRPTFYLAGLVALLVASPVVYWNYLHGWPSVTLHLVERMPAASAGTFVANARRILLAQVALFHPLVLPGLLAMLAVTVYRARNDDRYRLLAVASGPMLLFFFFVMVRACDAEPHWTMVGYVPLAVASGGWGDEQLDRANRIGKAYLLYLGSSVAGSTALVAVYAAHIASPALLRLLPESAYSANADPINETLGWDRVRAVIAEESVRLGPDAVVASEHNVLCGHLEVALDDAPAVYCPSPRRTEFDFIGRRAPPPLAPVIYVDSARYPGDPTVSLPDYSCARVREIAVERGGRALGRYRISECLPRGEVAP